MNRSIAALSIAMFGAPVLAHDLWLQVGPAPVEVGDTVAVALRIGELGTVEPLLFEPSRIEALFALSRAVPAEVVDGSGALLHRAPVSLQASAEVVRVEAARAGTLTIGYVGTPSLSTLPAAEFDAYLAEEHLDAVLAQRRAAATHGQPGAGDVHEHFSRSLKALVRIGDAGLVDCPAGLPLELSLVRSDDDALVVRATFEGRALAGAWLERGDRSARVVEEHRTDADGQARFTSGPGDWVLRTTHMRAAGEPGVQWRSWWATTSFAWDGQPVGECVVTESP